MTPKRKSVQNPKKMFLAIFDTMCGVSVCGVTGEDNVRSPDLYDSEDEWYKEQADILRGQADEVATKERVPCECGTDEELVEVLVYEDGRIISAFDGVTDYKVIFDRDD